MRKKITTGIAISVEPAITPPQSVPRAFVERLQPHGHRLVSGRFMITRAKMNSFQARMKAKMPVATRPGATSGSVIRMNAPKRLAPSTRAASSSSEARLPTKPRMSRS